MSRTVEVRVAGQNYRVVSSAPEEEVRRLAGAVNAKLAEIVPKGRVAPPNALLLAAIALAHEVEEEREKRESIERRAGELLRGTVARIDAVLESPDGAADEASAEGPSGRGADEDAVQVAGYGDDRPADDGAGAQVEARRGQAVSGAMERTAGLAEVSRET